MLALTMHEDFTSSAVRTLSVIADVSSWAVTDQPRLLSHKFPEVKLAFDDFSRANLNIESTDQGCRINLRHELIADDLTAKQRQEYWQNVFSELHKRLDV